MRIRVVVLYQVQLVLLQYDDRIDANHDYILEGTRRYLSSPSCLDGVYSGTFQRRLAEWSACFSSDYSRTTIPIRLAATAPTPNGDTASG
jgi:hypothetical protein